MKIRCLLWDFGDTLCDERFIWRSGPEWMEVYDSFETDGLGASWSLGEINTEEFAAALSERMARSPESIVDHMTQRCNHIRFFEKTFEFFKAHHLPQAIVTVNPDLFSKVIVPLCKFEESCEAIVTSWQEGTIDKRVLNQRALERMGMKCKNAEALLIDNKASNIEDWAGIGGAGYLYTDDRSFGIQTAAGADALVTRGR
jgi:hypothetical protein